MELRTEPHKSGVEIVYCGRARVGYVVAASRKPEFIWELILVSEQRRGNPRDFAPTREAALEKMTEMLALWMRAAGMEFRK